MLRLIKTVAFFEPPLQQTVTNDGTGVRERQIERTQAEEAHPTRTLFLPRAVACARQRVRAPAEGQDGAKRRTLVRPGDREDACEGRGTEKEVRSQASVSACGAFDSACRCRASTPAGPSGTTQPRSLRSRVNAPQDNRSLLTDSVDTPAVYAVPKAYWIANRWPTRCCVQAIICVPGYWISLRRRRRAWIGWGSAFRMHRQALGRVRSSPHLCAHCTHQSGPAARAAAANACAIAQKHGRAHSPPHRARTVTRSRRPVQLRC